MTLQIHTDPESGAFIAATFPALRDVGERALEQDTDSGEGRSKWHWLRLSNGDLMLGVFPQGDFHASLEQTVEDDYRRAQLAAQTKFPMPGDELLERRVIASCWHIDDERGQQVLVMLQEQRPPFFTVAYVDITADEPKLIASTSEMNIVHATEKYQEWGGDV